MRISRLIVAGVALVIAAGLTLIAMLGSGGSVGRSKESGADPMADPRGAALLNPYCRNVPAPGFEQPPNVPLTGVFDDAAYGYAVTIPPAITAYAVPDHPPPGFGIVLSSDPRAFLRIDAAYDVFFDITAAAVHQRDVLGVRLHDKLLADSGSSTTLGGERASRYRMQFQCPRDPQIYLRDDFIIVRNREIYRLELQTVPSRYDQDVELLMTLERSWQWRSVSKGNNNAALQHHASRNPGSASKNSVHRETAPSGPESPVAELQPSGIINEN